MEVFTLPPLAYIIHPITSGDLQENLRRLEMLRVEYNKQGKVIPIFPHEIIGPIIKPIGDQRTAYQACLRLLMRCDEAHVYSGTVPWSESTGCSKEVEFSYVIGKPVRYGWLSDNLGDKIQCH